MSEDLKHATAYWRKGLILAASLLSCLQAPAQTNPCPAPQAAGATVAQTAQAASDDIKQAEAQRKAAETQVSNINKGDAVDNAANLLNQVANFHFGRKAKEKTRLAAANPCPPVATPAALSAPSVSTAGASFSPTASSNLANVATTGPGKPADTPTIPGSGLIYSDTRTTPVDQAYKRGNAFWWFGSTAPLHGRPVVAALMITDPSNVIHFEHGVLLGYDTESNAYLKIVISKDSFAAGKTFRVDGAGNYTEVPAVPKGVSMPSSTTAAASAAEAPFPATVTPLSGDKYLVSYTRPGQPPAGLVMQKLNDGSAAASGPSDGIYRDARYVIVIRNGLATVNTVQP